MLFTLFLRNMILFEIPLHIIRDPHIHKMFLNIHLNENLMRCLPKLLPLNFLSNFEKNYLRIKIFSFVENSLNPLFADTKLDGISQLQYFPGNLLTWEIFFLLWSYSKFVYVVMAIFILRVCFWFPCSFSEIHAEIYKTWFPFQFRGQKFFELWKIFQIPYPPMFTFYQERRSILNRLTSTLQK